MADIARLAGVSTSTVSRALAGSPVIPLALRKEIQRVAVAQGYVVNEQARGLRLRRTNTISVIIPLAHEADQLISDPFFLEMVGRLSDDLTARGYDVLLSKVAAPTAGWLDRIVKSNRADGLLVIGQSDQHAALNALAEGYLPLVVWGGGIPEAAYCTVGCDNIAGGRLAVEHLLALGRRRIVFLGPPDAPEVQLRRQGYMAALSAAGVSMDPALLAPAHFLIEDAYRSVQDLIHRKVAFDAVFAASDVIALAAVQALSAAGRQVPADVSVVGFDDVAIARLSTPALTTIRQDLPGGARRMVELLCARIAGRAPESVILKPELIIRQT